MQLTGTFFDGMGLLLVQICLAAAVVFVAMCVDLISGLYKAKLRGEVHSSWGLKRSVQKFILYEGGNTDSGRAEEARMYDSSES